LTKVFLLPADGGRPRWADTCWRNSSEVIERREDKIRAICSGVSSGFTGIWVVGIWFVIWHGRIRQEVRMANGQAKRAAHCRPDREKTSSVPSTDPSADRLPWR
jgi:hypothetical protein